MTAEYIDTPELARRTNTSPSYWEKRRVSGKAAPPHTRIGRSVRYRWSDVEAWLAAQTRTSTSEG